MTGGGLPRGRSTLVCGGPGCGKSMLAMQFLVRGALEYDEPGVYISFEETATELSRNFESLGWDLETLIADGRLTVDTLAPSPSMTIGDWDLDALKIRIQLAIDSVGAHRVVIDTIELMINTPRSPTARYATNWNTTDWEPTPGCAASCGDCSTGFRTAA